MKPSFYPENLDDNTEYEVNVRRVIEVCGSVLRPSAARIVLRGRVLRTLSPDDFSCVIPVIE